MLDTATKKRIDDCRDILVGKLPDPKAQIEQITIGLIYKFMDDMDKEAIELGGAAKFFSGNFKKYSWDSLFDTKVTANEMLGLYSEAIISMDKNPNIPQLFRNIFKNAYLPYRDPETLKMFLRTIGEFEYTHSEKLGDAFEYLLSVMGSQGDAGQFRTPRHIIDFLVAVVDPSKTDTILDPACGTAGFLISAFKHIKRKAEHASTPLSETKGSGYASTPLSATVGESDTAEGSSQSERSGQSEGICQAERSGQAERSRSLTPDERKRLIQNVVGYDISPDMVRLSLVNLYLHGFSDPHISEYDTLSSEERWNDSFDVILANPPFMSPKGGIRPHKKFSISSNRSEVLFVDYIAEHLNPKGRAGIIVPEGVIFQSGTAYKDLRKMLVDNYLYAVVSLPSGIFNPYSGVKTSMLLMDKELAKTKEEVLFLKISNDGYGLGAQRNAVKGGQLGDAIEILKQFKNGTFDSQAERSRSLALSVPKIEIAKNGDYNLTGERYKTATIINSSYEFARLADVCLINPETIEPASLNVEEFVYVDISSVENGTGRIIYDNKIKTIDAPSRARRKIQANDILLSTVRPNLKAFGFVSSHPQNTIASTGFAVLRTRESIIPKYLFYNLFSENMVTQMVSMMGKGSYPSINQNDVSSIQIPLPPLSVQQEIVAEIEGYQKIIDGAKMVVENYKPRIEIDPEWKMVQLGKICEVKGGKRLPKGLQFSEQKTNHPYIRVTDFNNMSVDISNLKYISEEIHSQISRYTISKENVYISIAGTIGIMGTVPEILDNANLTENAAKLVLDKTTLDKKYLAIIGNSSFVQAQIKKLTHAVGVPKLALERIKTIKVPIPIIEIQHQIVAQIEKEQELVNANKQLIEIFELKIKDRIARVWGEDKPS